MVREIDENHENFYGVSDRGFIIKRKNKLVEDDFNLLLSNINSRFKRDRVFHRFKSDGNPTEETKETTSINGGFKFFYDEKDKKFSEVYISLRNGREKLKNAEELFLGYSIQQPERKMYSNLMGAGFALGILPMIPIWLIFGHKKKKKQQIIEPIEQAIRKAIFQTFGS